MLKVKEYVDICDYTTLKVGGQFRYLVELSDTSELSYVYKFAKDKGLPIFILGGGSNMVFPDGIFEKVILKIEFLGFDILNETEEYTDIKIGAGEVWDSVVERAVDMNLSGIEAMSAIPGTTGATPVQNVGAYGQEIKDTLVSVNVFNIENGNFENILNKDCHFSYRDSIFKSEKKGRYIITSIVLHLSKDKPSMPNYPGVKKYFTEKNIMNPTLLQIREAIIEIRKNKLPNPKEIPNVGSFFKNPIVKNDIAEKLKKDFPTINIFPINENLSKIPAGFLIEQAGLKGQKFGPISVYVNNALVLVNDGGATRSDVAHASAEIIKIVYDKFGIILENEPEFI